MASFSLVPAVPSHRGFGFSFGHPQFQLPSHTRPVRRDAQGLARSLTPECRNIAEVSGQNLPSGKVANFPGKLHFALRWTSRP